MISCMVQGRLGNQMFQYAFLRSLQEQGYDDEINLCFYLVNAEKDVEHGWENSLKYFKVSDFKSTNEFKLSFIQKVCKKINYYFLRQNRKTEIQEQEYEMSKIKFLNKLGFFWLNQGYYKFKKSHWKNKEAIGCFESAQYFNNIKEKLQVI